MEDKTQEIYETITIINEDEAAEIIKQFRTSGEYDDPTVFAPFKHCKVSVQFQVTNKQITLTLVQPDRSIDEFATLGCRTNLPYPVKLSEFAQHLVRMANEACKIANEHSILYTIKQTLAILIAYRLKV